MVELILHEVNSSFMPVGTQGTIKGVFTDDILKTGAQIILGNTYHLLLRPGIEILKDSKLTVIHELGQPILTTQEVIKYVII